MRSLIRFWFPPLAWAAVILAASSDIFSASHTGSILETVLTSVFGQGVPAVVFDTLHLLVRKLAHLTEYGILGALTFRAVRGERAGFDVRWAIVAVAIATAVAVTDEWRQSFIPSRTSSPVDMMIDCVGAAIAQAIVGWRMRFKNHL